MTHPSYTYPRKCHVRKRAEFDAVFERRQRNFQGPLGVYVCPNGLDLTRLGISMSRRVGIAARRNRIKRLLREAFRLQRQELPTGYDIVVVPKPHEPLTLADYLPLFRDAVLRACAKGAK